MCKSECAGQWLFALKEVDFGHFEGIDGSSLCRMTWEDMASSAGSHNAQVLFGYLSFLKKGNRFEPGTQKKLLILELSHSLAPTPPMPRQPADVLNMQARCAKACPHDLHSEISGR
ncbi:friend leukemia integration 1 transcription factor [Plakobranchus ocellatus]|uniref:Friend leukemia integration 1 transcription factor n=1 Tax=Plakobranchus ocellatus TaxID=259542 RepID=A0AAV4CTC4_9GAST|nr:friend leukemia integration 1 transcription factor [Plakobranchus ocellatus]